MKYLLYFSLLVAALVIAGCVSENQNSTITPTSQMETITPTPIMNSIQDPIIGVWRVTNLQGYDDRYRFNADGTYIESFYAVDSKITQIHSGTWREQGNNSYIKHDTGTGTTKTFNFDPTKNAIYFTELSHILLIPYQGEIANGIVYTTMIPTANPTTSPVVTKIARISYVASKPTIKTSTNPVTTTTSALTPTVTGIYPSTVSPGSIKLIIKGSNFRQYPPTSVYLRKHDSLCELCGQLPISVAWHSSTEIECSYYMPQESGDGTTYYDILVTNTYLQESNAKLPLGLTILYPTRTTITPVIIPN